MRRIIALRLQLQQEVGELEKSFPEDCTTILDDLEDVCTSVDRAADVSASTLDELLASWRA